MLMRDVKLKNNQFLKLLNELSPEVEKITKDESIWKRCLQHDLDRQNPEIRKKEGYPEKELYKHSPHWDILPDNCINLNGKMDPCGMDYLKYQMDVMANKTDPNASCGYPNKEIFFSLINIEQRFGVDKVKQLRSIVSEISYKFLGGNSVALTAFYPPGGYIPWHHNGNAPGWNILLHYSFGGNGSFFSWHDNEIIEYKDKDREWLCRAGRFLDTTPPHDRFAPPGQKPRGGEDVPHAGVMDASWHSARTLDWRFTLSTITNCEEIWLDIIDELETE